MSLFSRRVRFVTVAIAACLLCSVAYAKHHKEVTKTKKNGTTVVKSGGGCSGARTVTKHKAAGCSSSRASGCSQSVQKSGCAGSVQKK